MKVTRVRITLAENQRMKALAAVTFDDVFVVHDLRVIEGPNGLFVAMPSKKSSLKGTFRDIAHPITQDFRDMLEQAVLSEYHNLIAAMDNTQNA